MTAVAVLNRKGGVGKTTTAIGIGELVARLRPELRPVVIDLDGKGDDGQGDASTWADLARADNDPLAIEVVEPPPTITAVRLPGWVRSEYEGRFIVLDCPPAAGGSPEQEAAAEVVSERAGVVLVPTSAEMIDAVSTAATLAGISASVRVAVLLVKIESGTIRARSIREELSELIEGSDDAAGLGIDAQVLESEVPKRAELAREILAPLGPTSLLLNLYKPVHDEVMELVG